MAQSNLTLVLGATGKTGRRITERLNRLGVPTRSGSRSASPAFDWQAPETWKNAIEGVHSVYISYFPDLAVPGTPEIIRSFTKQAIQSGVKKLVLISGRGEPEAQVCESIVQDSGVSWTIVRCAWFAQNFSENFFLDGILAGEVYLPIDQVKEPFVDADDIADVAVAALTSDKHNGQVYELTGPRLISFHEAFQEISKASERSIRFVPVTIDQYVRALKDQNVPEDLISILHYLFTETLDGRNTYLTDGVQRALGRAPREFSEYVKRTKHTWVNSA